MRNSTCSSTTRTLSNLHEVTVIHGKGTGVPRTAVQQHLRHHKAVRSFRAGGVWRKGESGVTIVENKSKPEKGGFR